MLEMIHAGGFIMYIIIFCSIIALGFIIERFIVYAGCRTNMETFYPQFENLLKQGKIKEAGALCEQKPKLLPRLFLLGLLHANETIDDIRKILIDEIQIHVLPSLQRNLSVLAIIAKGAPMLGLLGTVLGMIETFEVVAIYGLGDPQKMADGIRYALVTTAGGLIVAIPILFVHAYFKARIRRTELEIHHYLTRFLRVMQTTRK